eukprot:6879299-Ditylum_brightwellii.AAC.1
MFPSVVVFGSKFSGGIRFTHLRATHLRVKICCAVKHIRAWTKRGKNFVVVTRWAQLSMVTSTLVLEEARALLYLEGMWLASLLQDMQQIKCKVVLHDHWMPALQRQGYSFIMKHIINSQSIHVQPYEPINWCRIYTKALLLTDICTPDRKYLADYMYDGEPPTIAQYNLDMNWPQQGHPNKVSWKIQSDMLRKIMCGADGRLHQPLRNWLYAQQKWIWSLYHKNETLYCQDGNTWVEYQQANHTHKYMFFQYKRIKTSSPE